MTLQHKFVDAIPDEIPPGWLFISLKYKSAIHKCPCGCGNEVVTPISPTDWQLTFDGLSISLNPSIGSWSLECKSHYWIIKNEIVHSTRWSDWQIKRGREENNSNKQKHYKRRSRKTKNKD